MKESKKAKPKRPQRPPCGQCGKPAHCYVQLNITELEFSVGLYPNGPTWRPNFGQGVNFTAYLCNACRSQSVKTALGIEATFLKAAKPGEVP